LVQALLGVKIVAGPARCLKFAVSPNGLVEAAQLGRGGNTLGSGAILAR
jgi:hypothetical protein